MLTDGGRGSVGNCGRDGDLLACSPVARTPKAGCSALDGSVFSGLAGLPCVSELTRHNAAGERARPKRVAVPLWPCLLPLHIV